MKLPEIINQSDDISIGSSVFEIREIINQLIDYLAEKEKTHMEIISNLTNLLLSDRPLNQERE